MVTVKETRNWKEHRCGSNRLLSGGFLCTSSKVYQCCIVDAVVRPK